MGVLGGAFATATDPEAACAMVPTRQEHFDGECWDSRTAHSRARVPLEARYAEEECRRLGQERRFRQEDVDLNAELERSWRNSR